MRIVKRGGGTKRRTEPTIHIHFGSDRQCVPFPPASSSTSSAKGLACGCAGGGGEGACNVLCRFTWIENVSVLYLSLEQESSMRVLWKRLPSLPHDHPLYALILQCTRALTAAEEVRAIEGTRRCVEEERPAAGAIGGCC